MGREERESREFKVKCKVFLEGRGIPWGTRLSICNAKLVLSSAKLVILGIKLVVFGRQVGPAGIDKSMLDWHWRVALALGRLHKLMHNAKSPRSPVGFLL